MNLEFLQYCRDFLQSPPQGIRHDKGHNIGERLEKVYHQDAVFNRMESPLITGTVGETDAEVLDLQRVVLNGIGRIIGWNSILGGVPGVCSAGRWLLLLGRVLAAAKQVTEKWLYSSPLLVELSYV